MKGIILAGGYGTRLYPSTRVCNKQLLPVYDKPMVYYPLVTLMLIGVGEIIIISTPKDIPQFKATLGDGTELGIQITYQIEEKPQGIANAFLIAEKLISNHPVCLILGDNLFYGPGLAECLQRAWQQNRGATIFGYQVRDPKEFGVVEIDDQGQVLSLEEKPVKPKSHFAVPGLYMFDNQVVEIAKRLKPSRRGELEITDVNLAYLRQGKLCVEILHRNIAWFDMGTPANLRKAANFIAATEQTQGVKVGCVEEIAFTMGLIHKAQLMKLAEAMPGCEYSQYLLALSNCKEKSK